LAIILALKGVDFISKWLLIIFILLVALNLLPLKLDLRFRREPNHIEVKSRLHLWFLPLEMNLVNPMTSAVHRMSTNSFWFKEPPQDLRAKDVPWRRFFARVGLFKKVFLPIYRLFNSFLQRICRPIKVKRLHLYTEIGLDDAADTAVAVGLIWGFKGFAYSRIASLFNILESENKLAVVPNFQQPGYVKVDYSCIFEFRLGHISIMIYYTLRSIGEIRKLLRRLSR